MSILGVSAFHHDSAAALISNHKILGASHEERFSRIKYDKRWPQHTIQWLQSISNDINVVAFYDRDNKKDSLQLIRKQFPKAEVSYVDHHESHGMSSILMTDWEKCAVMVVDTVGGKFSTSLGVFEKGKFTWLKRFRYPNSLGLFYSAATKFLGLRPLHDESQVMAAAGFGIPKWVNVIEKNFIDIKDDSYRLKVDLQRGLGTLGLDWDVASSVQRVTEHVLINLASWLQKETGLTNLAYSGGVALNCVANTEIYKNTGFKNIAIQPAAGDAGCALGAAALIERPTNFTPYIGYNAIPYKSLDEVVTKLLKGEIVPVINGRAEFGPRALGNRSYLAIPNKINSIRLNQLKKRETDSWRPWAPICLESLANDYFKVYNKNYNHSMLFVSDTLTELWYPNNLQNARLQVVTPKSNMFLSKVLYETTNSGYPILINTSLNARGKPIVNSATDYEKEIKS